MITLIIQALYFMLPAYLANMAPVIVRKWTDFLNYPIDFEVKLWGKPLFGSHKTFRGFFFGTLFGIAMCYLQHLVSGIGLFSSISLIDYNNWLLIGFLMGFGALLGDLVKSFFKRRVGIKPGKVFFPFDQIDFVVGALILTAVLYIPPISLIITALLLSIILHVTMNHVAYYLKIRKEKW